MMLILLLALAVAPAPAVTLDPSELHFAAEVRAGGATRVTPPQVVFLELAGADALAWSATVDRDWLHLGTLRGSAPTTLVIDVSGAGIANAGVKDEAHVTFTFGAGADTITRTLRVTLDVLSEGHAPIGAFDQPADGTTVRGGGVRLSGWALDDIGLADVEICRDPLPRTPPGAACGGRLMHLGSATFYDAARPDVASAFPSAPRRDRSGWTFVLDTDAMPRTARGTFRVHAAAKDLEGHSTLLGSKTVTVEPGDEGSSFGRLAAVLGPLVLLAAAVHGSVLLWRSRAARAAPVPEEPSQRAISALEAVAIAAIVAVAASIQLPAMRAGLGYDELYTWRHFVEGASFWKAASTVGVFNNHIAYSLLAVASVRLFGMSEWALRLPALLLGAGAVYCLWRFVREFAGPAAALLSALLLALSPMHVAWSRSARGYTGLALMTIVSSHRFFTLLRQPSRRAAIEHVLATTGAIYFHIYGIWAGLIQYVLFTALAIKSRLSPASFRLLWRSFAAVLVMTVLVYSPVVLDLIAVGKARGRTAVQSGFPLALFDAIAGADSTWVRAIAAVLVVAGFVRLGRRAWLAAYFALLLAVPFCAVWLVLRPLDLYARFFEFWTPVFCALVGVAVFARVGRRDVVFVIPAAVMALVLLVNWVGQDLQPVSASGYREALPGRAAPPAGSRTFVVGADADMLAYYLPRPVASIESVEELERAMRQPPYDMTVAYHNMTWNSPEHQRVAELLSRRCRSASSGPVRFFRCGIMTRTTQ
jgi:dolichyl-phosphate-mannose-protein mannosyltransferase